MNNKKKRENRSENESGDEIEREDVRGGWEGRVTKKVSEAELFVRLWMLFVHEHWCRPYFLVQRKTVETYNGKSTFLSANCCSVKNTFVMSIAQNLHLVSQLNQESSFDGRDRLPVAVLVLDLKPWTTLKQDGYGAIV
ncbi:2-oxoglutarate and Fe(II)-dependent oxygenase superfamily protein [Prunus dulcis]|uniref:2-oxoglutarate and Fe(II)-dependent oxygenase superfamily protein n=1 Tax=Prunus dulcis TaxID=3755 RepID=A0A5H2XM22_PRUDU|nr:2-oxoglutarate and Fe(II)-dependent oxygenase superfamily protein [Prunus dulcis]